MKAMPAVSVRASSRTLQASKPPDDEPMATTMSGLEPPPNGSGTWSAESEARRAMGQISFTPQRPFRLLWGLEAITEGAKVLMALWRGSIDDARAD